MQIPRPLQTTLASYTAGSVANDGANPQGSLTLSGTTFYGMTIGVGNNSDSSGTIFRINADGTGYQVLYNFGSVNNGANPHGDLILSGSTLYGMTLGAGALGAGTIFKINNDGTGYQVLHNFGSIAKDGCYPYGSLTLSGTTLYGMTSGGGAGGLGTIFQINTSGTGYQVLYSFGSVANDGTNPFGSLTLSGTMLYGMTQVGGAAGLGTIFQINTSGGEYQVLYSFAGYPNDGALPVSSLTLSGSTLYGMTSRGGSGIGYGMGTIFQINTNGTGYQVLYDFGSASSNDGGSVTLLGTTIYGMEYGGGVYDKGMIFSVSDSPAVPDAPTGVTAAAGNSQAAVSFTAPAGGPPVSSYTVTSNPGGITVTGAGSPIIVQGLTNGTAYTFTVTATNTIGTGPPSGPSNSVTPYAVPPSSIAALAGTWNANFIVSGTDAPEWERGTLTMNPDGTLSGVSITDNNGNPDQVINSDASAFWSSPGGLFLTTGQPNNILCQIDSGNTVIACTQTDFSNGSPRLLMFTKQASSCSLADLTGAWEGNFLTSSGQYSGAAETDSLTVNSNGTWTDSTTSGTGTWSISSTGVITNPSDSSFSGVMDADKTVMVATSGANINPAVLGVYAKQAASYLPADLAGTWQGNSLSMWTWERDTLTINEDGTFTMSYTANDGSTNNNITGTATLSPNGAVTLVVNTEPSQSIIYGDMAADKTVMVTTVQTSINDYNEIFTKSAAAGSLTVTISPAGAVSAGAMWSVDGAAWQASEAMVSNLSVGSHTVAFNNIAGWITPASQTANITNGQAASLSGAYVQQTQSGALTVTISPAGAVSTGAMWNVDGGAWQATGATVSSLSVGMHTASFKGIQRWTTPPSQTFNISNGQTTSLTGAYVQQTQSGSLTVTISPADAVSEGAMWNVDGGSWQGNGTTVSGITVGSHTVAFKNITGWSIPSGQTAKITNGQTTSAIGTYTPVFAAIFTASTTSGKAPVTVDFTDSSVGNITKWLWNFGDGQTSKIRSPSHTYSKVGTYTVALTVTGAGGTNTCTYPNYITVYAAPKANFTASPTSGKAPLQVVFTDKSTGLVSSWLWAFGDGAASTVQSPEHTYNTTGTQAAKLTVTGPGGSSTKTMSIRLSK
jgi:uncharacterized repeat protein (TIGR03803 family)